MYATTALRDSLRDFVSRLRSESLGYVVGKGGKDCDVTDALSSVMRATAWPGQPPERRHVLNLGDAGVGDGDMVTVLMMMMVMMMMMVIIMMNR